jgi:predicted deacylase
LSDLGGDLRAVLVEDEPTLATVDGVATTVRTGGDPVTAFDRLAAAADKVAALAADQPGTAWTRTGRRATGPVSAADLLREAVHAGVHHLRAAGSDAAR